MIKILIADDQKLFRDGLKAMLADPSTEIKVIGEAGTGFELMPLLKKNEIDLILMDFNMPDMDGLAATEHVRKNFPEIKILMLSMMENEKYVAESLQAGAKGYILKTIDRKELIHAIHTVAGGHQYISTQIAINLLKKDGLHQPNSDRNENFHEDKSKELSKRELEVLRLVAQGYTNEQIADTLFTSRRTIESHRQHLLEKTGSKNTASMIVYASRHNLLE